MKEIVFNLFLYIDQGIITQIGVTTNEITGSDNEKLKFMKKAVGSGLEKNVQFLVPSNFKVFVNGRTIQGITYDTYKRMCSMGAEARLFEEIFEHYHAWGIPLIWITSIVDGVVKEDAKKSFVTNENYATVAS